MQMEVKRNPITVADYCDAYDRKDVIVNNKYQRNDEVWPTPARSFLIETICAGYPMPKLIMNQITDLKTRRTFKEIVDGQQRSKAITDFFHNKLRLSRNLENKHLAGKIYDELSEEYQHRFLTYNLDIDLFIAAGFDSVVEAFRRMNNYTFPLNAAEKRHAKFQGGYKWFVFYFCRRYESYFRRAKIFSDKALVRMLDTTLVAEIWDSLESGIRTTKSAELDALYKRYNTSETFEGEPLTSYLAEAFDTLQGWPDIDDSSLAKHYMIYALVLALIHVRHDIESLRGLFPSPKLRVIDSKLALRNLTTLASAFANKDESGPYAGFVLASSGKTNVQSQREGRFIEFCKALVAEI